MNTLSRTRRILCALALIASATEAADLYQAEDRTASRDVKQISVHRGYSGAGYIDFGDRGAWIEWNDIVVPADGRYELQVRYANGSANGRLSDVILNGRRGPNLSFTSTGGWASWETERVSVELRRGRNTVRIEAITDAGGPNIDQMVIENRPAADSNTIDSLSLNQELNTNDRLTSQNQQYILVMQGDGNLVLRNTVAGDALWSTRTNGKGAVRFRLQGDGNLVLRTSKGDVVWSSGTFGKGAVKLTLQNDGNLVLRTAQTTPVWATDTAQPVPDTTPPVIALNGAASMSVVQGATFTDPGATATDDRDGNISNRIVVAGAVDTTTIGSYTLRYNVSDAAGNEANPITRSVSVIRAPDTTKPVITLRGAATLTVEQGSTFTDPGATATDDRDGNITSRVVVSGSVNTSNEGNYTLRYDVKDAAGNAANTVIRTVTVIRAADNIKPVITLNGNTTILIVQNTAFTDPGATASDDRDGNITSRIRVTGAVNTAVVGSYVLRYDVSDAAGNAADTVTRTVSVTRAATTISTSEFSTPSAAIYSLNDSRRRGFPRVIDTGFGGNGHAETWDGRIFVRTQSAGWFASAFRPERIVRTNDNAVDFKQGAFGSSILLESNEAAPDFQHNWIAIIPDASVAGENPYPSTANGNYSATGSYRTYKALVYHTSKRNGDNDQMGYRKATFIVGNANTRDAQVTSASFTSDFRKLTVTNGADFRCIEPSITIDGRLIICQGHPDNNGRIDNLVYSWNAIQGATVNWRVPKSIANMYWDDRLSNVDGVPFHVRFPIADKPLRDAIGNEYKRGELIKGAYPWVSHDGTELFYQSSREGVSARRTGTTVIGRWTGWIARHIDGPINPYRHVASRLFLSSPGAFTTMWSPYKDVDDLKIPYSVRGPSYPMFGSNSHDYMEIGFDDYLDGNYVFYFGMNEQLDRAGIYQKTKTNDTSGNFNNGTLVGAKFPLEYNNRDEIVGRYGQAIYFPANAYVEVGRNKGWDTLEKGVSVDFWLKKINGSGTVRLFTMQDGLEVFLSNGSNISAAITDTNNRRVVLNGTAVATNEWQHIGFTYDVNRKEMKLYVNGVATATRSVGSFSRLRSSGTVRIGPDASSALLLLDEVKLSNVTRLPYEMGHYANIRIHKAASSALTDLIPDHLRSLRFQATGIDRFSLSAAALGETLFSDTILSKQRTTSCATCHEPNRFFTDGLAIARGKEPTDAGKRHTPTIINRLFSRFQGWSGEGISLDTQAIIPIEATHEMNLPVSEAVSRLTGNTTYANRFQQVFGEGPTAQNIAISLASFQATQLSPRTRVDNFRGGNRSALSASERRGLDLFEGKARCSGCHAGVNYTDESFRNNGLTNDADAGRGEQTDRNRDHRLFKVPSLRNIASTAPYMHDGSMMTLREVLEAYNRGAIDELARDSDIRPLELSNQELQDLEAYLQAL